MRMIRQWRALRIFLQLNGGEPAAAEWTAADAVALASFLRSATGVRMQAVLRGEIAAANERAVLSRGERFEAGWASGFRGLLAWLESLALSEERELGEAPSTLDELLP